MFGNPAKKTPTATSREEYKDTKQTAVPSPAARRGARKTADTHTKSNACCAARAPEVTPPPLVIDSQPLES